MTATPTRKRRPRRRAASLAMVRAIACIDAALAMFAEVVREAEQVNADRQALGCADAADTARPDLLAARRELLLSAARDDSDERKLEAEVAAQAAAIIGWY